MMGNAFLVLSNKCKSVRFEILTAVTMMIAVFALWCPLFC